MGYRSDVFLAALFKNEQEYNEVMAIYAIDPKVQEEDVAKYWQKKVYSTGHVLCYYHATDVKWYDSYDDVQALMYMQALCRTFADEREFMIGWKFVRIGEETADIEEEQEVMSDDYHYEAAAMDMLYDIARVVRHIELGL